jgi:uncharacterized protein YdcH (DUF465 family)
VHPTRARFFRFTPEPDSAQLFEKRRKLLENQSQDEELKAHLLTSDEQFRLLAEQHALLKKQIESIESKAHVTGDDELEEQRLKKLKLHVKDQMNEIIDRHKHAGVH